MYIPITLFTTLLMAGPQPVTMHQATQSVTIASAVAVHQVVPLKEQDKKPPTNKQASDEGDQTIVRIYDLRDLDQAIPQTSQARGYNLDSILDQFSATGLALNISKLNDGLYAIETDAKTQVQFESMLSTLRDIYSTRYDVQVSVFSVDAGKALPDLGSTVMLPPDARTIRQKISKEQVTPFRSVSDVSYIASWQPVVSTDAVAYEPQVKSGNEGVDLSVAVGPAQSSSDHRPGTDSFAVHISGTLSKINVKLQSGPAEHLSVALPAVVSRPVDSTVAIPQKQLTVIAVVPTFDDQGHFIIAAEVH